MLTAEHERAQELADQADDTFAQANFARAEELYSRAAELEMSVFRSVPVEDSRTAAILGLSAAALLYHARRFDESAAIAGELLKRDDVPASTRASLEELLAAMPASRWSETWNQLGDSLSETIAEADEIRRRADSIKETYLDNRELLLSVAVGQFRIPETDAEHLIQEVFVSYLQARTPVSDIRSWLLGAMSNASRHYWRAHGRTEAIAERAPLPEALALLQRLSPRTQEAVRLYLDGLSYDEIAEKLDTTPRFAHSLVERALKQIA